jgi:hypothetical protein
VGRWLPFEVGANGRTLVIAAPQIKMAAEQMERALSRGRGCGAAAPNALTLWKTGRRESKAFRIHVEPFASDNYPDIARKMRARGAQYLFLGACEGQGSAPNDFEKILNSADIAAVYRAAVDAALTAISSIDTSSPSDDPDAFVQPALREQRQESEPPIAWDMGGDKQCERNRADVSATRRTMAVSEEDLTKLLKQRLTYCMEIEDISKRLQELQDKIETDGDDWGHRLLGFSVTHGDLMDYLRKRGGGRVAADARGRTTRRPRTRGE